MIHFVVGSLLVYMLILVSTNKVDLVIGIAVSLLKLVVDALPLLVPVAAAIAAVGIRFWITQVKLKRAIKSEVYKMDGIKRCADNMEER